MLGRVQSKSKELHTSRPAKPPVGRERLAHLDEEIKRGKTAVSELEQQIQRLDTIIVEAAEAHKALQAAITADGGVELTAYAAGKASEHFSKLVITAENSGRAATAAKAALPSAHSDLDNAKAQVLSLGEQRAAELSRVLALLADVDARAYSAAFENLCRLHDRLVGFAAVAESNQGDIRRIQDPLKTPRFALPSMGSSESDPFLRHQTFEFTVGESSRMWTTIRDRLATDANADLTDLIL